MNEAEILRKAKALIENGWCQGSNAKDSAGDRCDERSDRAASFCALGALVRIRSLECQDEYPWTAPTYLIPVIHSNDIVGWNDAPSRTKAEVVEAFERAAQRAEKGPTT